MSRPPPPARRQPPGPRFRTEIEAAAADGAERDQMVLRLTLGDATALRRDPAIPLADLSFAGGAMRYLGVKVESGGVAESSLDTGG